MPIEFHVPLQLNIPFPLTEAISGPPSGGIDPMKPILLIPDVKYLTKFANGELGIADEIKKNMIAKNLSNPPNLESLAIFTSVSNSKLSQDPKSFVKPSGKINVPKDAISLTSGDDSMGIKALEKTAIKSIFETQKPYMEIIKLMVESLVKLEDVAARLTTNLDYTNPVKPKGLKPKVNPRALGYKGNRNLNIGLSKLSSLQNKTTKEPTVSTPGVAGTGDDPIIEYNTNGDPFIDGYNSSYQTISEIYSTGKKLKGIEYDTTYIDIIQKVDGIDPDTLDDTGGDIPEDDFTTDFPETIVLAIFDDNGGEIPAPEWLANSGKWYGKFDFVGPTVWWWKSNLGEKRSSTSYPSTDEFTTSWERVKKKAPDGTEIDDEFEKYFTSGQIQDYVNFIHKYVNLKVDAAKPSGAFDKLLRNMSTSDFAAEKEEARSHVLGMFNSSEAETQLDALSTGGFLPGLPSEIVLKYGLTLPRQPFRPVEKVLNGKNLLLDPEGDYEMRIIKISTTFDITYLETSNVPELSGTILRFLKNSHDITLIDNTPFTIYLRESYNGSTKSLIQTNENITSIAYDNLGLNDLKITDPNKDYEIEVWRKKAPSTFLEYATLDNNVLTEIKSVSDHWDYRQYNISTTFNNPSAVVGTTLINSTLNVNLSDQPMGTASKSVVAIQVGSGQYSGDITKYIYDDSSTTTTPPSTWENYTTTWVISSVNSGIVNTTKYTISANNTKYKIVSSSGISTRTEISVADDTIDINTYTIIVKSNIITDWKSYKGPITPVHNKKKVVVISNVKSLTTVNDINTTTTDLPVDAIRVTSDIPSGKIISGTQITNSRLKVGQPYAEDNFAVSTAPAEMKTTGYGDPDPFQMWRYPTSDRDLFPMYLVEAVLPEKNKGSDNTGANAAPAGGGGGGGSNWYKRPHSIGAVKVMLSIVTDILTKLIPKIKQFIKIIKNPASFIFEILQEKLGENFDVFGKDFKKTIQSLPSYAANIASIKASLDQATTPQEIKARERQLKSAIKKMEDKVKASGCYNYVHIHPDTGKAKFLWDGSATIKFMTLVFGLKLDFLDILPEPLGKSAKAPLSLIMKLLSAPSGDLDCSYDEFNATVQEDQRDVGGIKKNPANGDGSGIPDNGQGNMTKDSSQYAKDINGLHYEDIISEWYSTGKFVKGVDYNYTYLTEEVTALVKQADDLLSTSPDDPKVVEQALDLYDNALKKDPGNKFINDKIEDIRKKYQIYPHPLFNLLLSLITTPLKIIFGIIKYIMCFFKEINIGNIVSKLKEFFTFKWILDFFKPLKLLALLGIKFDIDKFKGWIKDINTAPIGTIYDLSQVIDIVFIPKLFKVNKEQLLTLIKQPLHFLNAILCLIESIINGFIDFVWALLGLGAILKAPHLKLCKKSQQDMTLEEVMNLLGGGMKDDGPDKSDDTPDGTQTASLADQPATETNYDFIYEIKTSDGRLLRDLNRNELEQWLEENGGYQFIFNL